MYIYPDNLKQKATMWLWTLGDLVIIGAALLVSIVMLVKLMFFPPIVITAVFAFLSIQFDGMSVKDFLRYAINFFIAKPQYFTWRAWSEDQQKKNREKKAFAGAAIHPKAH
ncbi:hypothetical protein LJC63_10905 [Ruminococcaceae bacterium OttesenSCG-928-L11]|nr:hypothetical protein [Ruminococcaceae bacterium OttesenSCG-928-L11]